MGLIGPAHNKPWLGVPLKREHPLARGLVGCWLMNEGRGDKVYDLSGNGNTGTIVNAVWSGGKFGPCLYFDGTGDYVDCGANIGNFGTADFSITAWVLAQNSTTVDIVVAKGIAAAGDIALYKTNTDDRFIFYADAGLINIGAAKTGWVNNWIHLVAIRNAANAYLYINGILVGTDTSAGTANISNPHNFTIGGSEGGPTNPYIGSIDNIQIWNRALSPSEIQQLYMTPFRMFEREPIEIWTAASYVPPAGDVGFMTLNTRYWGT